MDVKLFLLADFANRDSAGKLNVLGIFDRVYSSQFPVRLTTMCLVAMLGVGLGESGAMREFTVKLIDEDGAEIWRVSGTFNTSNRPEANLILQIINFEFPAAGSYEFVLLIDKDQKASHPIEVIHQEKS